MDLKSSRLFKCETRIGIETCLELKAETVLSTLYSTKEAEVAPRPPQTRAAGRPPNESQFSGLNVKAVATELTAG